MAVFRSPVFIICGVLFIIHQALQYILNIRLSTLDSYLDNLVAMPIILSLYTAEKIWLFGKGDKYVLPGTVIFAVTLYIIVISEVLFPRLSDDFIADPIDGVCYAAGSILYYFHVQLFAPKSFKGEK